MSSWTTQRRKPYSAIGVRRLACIRCGGWGRFQWNVCADGSYRPLCLDCDIDLNRLVLVWMGHPNAAAVANAYAAKKRAAA